MPTYFAEREEPVKRRSQRFLQKQSTVSIRWMAALVGNVRPVKRLQAGTFHECDRDRCGVQQWCGQYPSDPGGSGHTVRHEGKYKVYIIDEVHMLSIGAFNALLKTSGGATVICDLYSGHNGSTQDSDNDFSLRCQRYDFQRISIDTIAGRLTGSDGERAGTGGGESTPLCCEGRQTVPCGTH